jgi:hypothetical protein
MRRNLSVAVALGLCLYAGAAAAQGKPEYITGNVGYLDLRQPDPSSKVELEWGLGVKYWLFVPESAAPDAATKPTDRFLTLQGGGAQGGGTQGGVGLELSLGDSFMFTPSIAAGPSDRAESRDPTDPANGQIEVRTGIQAAYEFSNDWRVGATYFHITNPNQDGPSLTSGGDVLSFTLAVPFGTGGR